MRTLWILLCLCSAFTAHAATFVVTSAADTAGSSCGSSCTLRQAITAANATPAADIINFDIDFPVRGEILIQPASALPTITQPLTIDGYSQGGTRVNNDPQLTNAVLRIRLDGLNAGPTSPGLAICASNVTIRGLIIGRFAQQGLRIGSNASGQICTASAAQVLGNFIGTSNDGTVIANDGPALDIRGSSTVGSASLQDRNVLIGSNTVRINNGQSTITGNLINLNRFGIAHTGNVALRLNNGVASQSIGTLAAPNRIGCNQIAIELNGAAQNNLLHNNHFIAGSANCLPIDLGADGVTPNDPDDVDSGPNDLQNFPVISAASRAVGGLSITANLDVGHADSNPYAIALYASSACSSNGHGPGERLLGVVSRNISSTTQSFSYMQATADPLEPGTVITATATRNGVGTSEMSACFELDPPPLIVNGADDSNDGSCDAVHCSLREAILAANASSNPNPAQIHFAIPSPPSGEIRIDLLAPLPTITRTLAMDGYTQPGSAPNTDPEVSNAVLRIRLSGSTRPLSICADNVSVRGLSLTSAANAAISVGNNSSGSACTAGDGAILVGNFIGLPPSGQAGSPNLIGIQVSSRQVQIGGLAPADRNVISGNAIGLSFAGDGVDGSVVQGNLFGTDPTGALDRGNPEGIKLVTTSAGINAVQVGGLVPNRLRFNGKAIVASVDNDDHHRFLANRISDSDVIGIDLGNDGVTPNDPDDVDNGPNGLQNFPELTQVSLLSPTVLRIAGHLDVQQAAVAESFRIDVYANSQCHPGGHGESQFHLGFAEVDLTNGFGEDFVFELVTDVDLAQFDQITTTATGLQGTSEFSACRQISDALLADGFE